MYHILLTSVQTFSIPRIMHMQHNPFFFFFGLESTVHPPYMAFFFLFFFWGNMLYTFTSRWESECGLWLSLAWSVWSCAEVELALDETHIKKTGISLCCFPFCEMKGILAFSCAGWPQTWEGMHGCWVIPFQRANDYTHQQHMRSTVYYGHCVVGGGPIFHHQSINQSITDRSCAVADHNLSKFFQRSGPQSFGSAEISLSVTVVFGGWTSQPRRSRFF